LTEPVTIDFSAPRPFGDEEDGEWGPSTPTKDNFLHVTPDVGDGQGDAACWAGVSDINLDGIRRIDVQTTPTAPSRLADPEASSPTFSMGLDSVSAQSAPAALDDSPTIPDHLLPNALSMAPPARDLPARTLLDRFMMGEGDIWSERRLGKMPEGQHDRRGLYGFGDDNDCKSAFHEVSPGTNYHGNLAASEVRH
jgi:hypothetical protein